MGGDSITEYYKQLLELYNLAQAGDPEAISIYPKALQKYNELLASQNRKGIQKAQFYDQIEDQINKRVNDRIKEHKQKLKKRQYAGSPIELGQWTCDPDCSDDYEDLSKDEYLGNLDKQEYNKLTQDDELIGILADSPVFFSDLLPLCIRRRKSALTMSNSKAGFARRLLSEENINLRKISEETISKPKRIMQGAYSKKQNW